jgi:HD superfamily phosphodiesterase
MSQENGIVRLKDLPSYIYIDITPYLKSKILFQIKEKYGNYSRSAKELKWDENRIYRFIKGHKISLEFISDVIGKLKISKHELEKNITKIGFPNKKIKNVERVILQHTPASKPKSKEAKLLHDADLLDFLGASGIVRLSAATPIWWGKFTLNDTEKILEKFRKTASKNLVLKESKKFAKNKIEIMNRFLNNLKKEIKVIF